jgi:AmiR/NasT family two-component response regulator
LANRLALARSEAEQNLLRLEVALACRTAIFEEITDARSARAKTHDEALHRLEARLADLPVLEEARGILMVELGCSAKEALKHLRRLSREQYLEVTVVAETLVQRAIQDRQHPRR